MIGGTVERGSAAPHQSSPYLGTGGFPPQELTGGDGPVPSHTCICERGSNRRAEERREQERRGEE